MWRLGKLQCLFPDRYDITCRLKSFERLTTMTGSITLFSHLCALEKTFFDVSVRVEIEMRAPEVHQVLGGGGDWVFEWVSVSLMDKWCVETCIPVRPYLPPSLSGWPAVSPHPAATNWEDCVHGLGRAGVLERPPFLRQLQREAVLDGTKGLSTCRDINGETPSSCGEFHSGGLWSLAHPDVQGTAFFFFFFMGRQQNSNNSAGAMRWLKHPF